MSRDIKSMRDVRMHGFTKRAEVSTVIEWIDAHARRLESETVPIAEAYDRVLSSSVIATVDVPPFDRVSMDGYALRGDETAGASDYNPLTFVVEGEAFPARPYEGVVAATTAARVMTGSRLPDGADSVVPAEYAVEADGSVAITQAVAPGKNVGVRGEDIRSGTTVLEPGRRLRPQDCGLVASIGVATLAVVRRPRVRLIVTGNEIVAPGSPKTAQQIFDANSEVLRGLVARDGGVVESHRRVGDEPDAILAAMTAEGADVILVSGGSSVGAEDHAPRLLAAAGELAIHGVAMRPSSPAGVGRIERVDNDILVFLLPGNPVSCLCAYDFFAGRAIRIAGGRRADWPHRRITATVARKIASEVGRVDYCRVRVVANESGNEVEPLALSGASILSSTTRADGFVIVPADSEGYGAGTVVDVYLYD